MNILFCYFNGFEHEKGGAQKVAFNLGCFLESKGNVLYYLAGNHAVPNGQISLSHQFFLPNNNIFSKENEEFYNQILDRLKINLVVNHDASNNRSNFFLKKFPRNDIKMISFHHNDPLVRISNSIIIREKINYKFTSSVRIFLKKILIRREVNQLVKSSNSIVFLSPGIIKDLNTKLNIKSEKFTHIYNPLDLDLEGTLNNSKKMKRVVCVGRLDIKHKRLDILLKIWKNVEILNKTHELVIVGGGNDESKLKDIANQLKLQRVKFVGFTNPVPYYETSEVSVLTSDYEGFSMVMVESLFYGAIPVLFNNWAAVSDFVKHDVNGLVIEPGNEKLFEESLLALLEDKKHQMILRGNNMMTLGKLESKSIGETWLRLIQNLR